MNEKMAVRRPAVPRKPKNLPNSLQATLKLIHLQVLSVLLVVIGTTFTVRYISILSRLSPLELMERISFHISYLITI